MTAPHPFRVRGERAADEVDDDEGNEEAPPSEPPPRARRSRSVGDTAVAARNFTVPLEATARALVGGPPAYARRKRNIEDLEESLMRALAAFDRAGGSVRAAIERRVAAELADLNALIVVHNRCYPSEANLPVDPSTGQLLELGEPWSPLPPATRESLRARARALAY